MSATKTEVITVLAGETVDYPFPEGGTGGGIQCVPLAGTANVQFSYAPFTHADREYFLAPWTSFNSTGTQIVGSVSAPGVFSSAINGAVQWVRLTSTGGTAKFAISLRK
jgi:hypothetical protein